ncbi:anti-sigma factor [Pseudarthrobacter raffinosi]|uniref:anti-sigma factor n=1 Tax=Pseudarthrobacter raffinosi TaxID=2953651 RepID=UPI00208DF257|nr:MULTISPECIES: anti-sigma factor [unclassified Pseudarthrobacter]MCO4235922.1 anti-sigma factor [Pseudarthrobacter sp. MDT3-28]MCO4250891.1 anti-sigma factor [Pseudarthrobacter sp. MDT3-9]MCO4263486.1 anti-sigma factor [Pseudarthrobacter sp. MDT3-26]
MTPQNPFGRRHHRGADHVQTCAECAAALKRERQYIERLRDAAVPPASEDLTARLLVRTQLLAAAAEPAPSPYRAARAVALAAGGTAAAAGVLAVSAFALAGDSLPVAQSAINGSLVQHTARLPADGREISAPQLLALRSEGWVCPELASLGFHVRSANAITLNGRPAVEMHLTDGQHYATIVEQHPVDAEQQSGEDTQQNSEQIAGQNEGKLLVSSQAPWRATVETTAGTFIVESDLPAEQADDAVPVLQRLSVLAVEGINAGVSTAPADSPVTAADDSPAARLERGIRKLGEMLAP